MHFGFLWKSSVIWFCVLLLKGEVKVLSPSVTVRVLFSLVKERVIVGIQLDVLGWFFVFVGEELFGQVALLELVIYFFLSP